MISKKKYNNDFWLTLFAGSLMVILVIMLGVSFFSAILNTQLSSRKDYLIKQTELAAQSLEIDINRFEEDAQFFLNYLEEDQLKSGNFNQDFTTTMRRVFNNYPGLIDSVWVDLNDSLVSFTMTARGNFIRRSFQGDLEEKKLNMQSVYLKGKKGIRVLFSIDLVQFSKNFVSNYYLNPAGGKFLILKDKFLDIGATAGDAQIKIDAEDYELIKQDISDGVMGVYELEWVKNKESVKGILVQYPFDFGEIEEESTLAFFVESEDLTSGVYNTFFILFVGLVTLLMGTVGIFIRSINNNLNSQRILKGKNKEISALFDQQSLLLRELHGFVFFHDSQGFITHISDEVEEILGYPKKLIFDAFQKNSQHEDVKKIRSKIIDSVERHQSWIDFEYDFTSLAGEKLRFRIFEKLIFDKYGNFKGGTGICTNVTKQYLDRMELENSENRLRSVIENIPDIITIYDTKGEVLDIKFKEEAHLFHGRGHVVGQYLADLLPENQKSSVLASFEMVLRTNLIQTVEVMIQYPKGNKYFEVRFFPLDKSQIMSLAKDITSQKIWENGLVQAVNASDNANRAKSEFLANMSHEIRTPMNGLLGVIDLLENTMLDKEQKLYVEIVKNSGNSLLGIIKDILDYSKIEAGKIDLIEEVFSPAMEVEKLVQIFIGMSQKKQIKITTQSTKDAYELVVSDKEKINQILLNLVGNAIKFTPEGGAVSIFLNVESLPDGFCVLKYEVVDTGIGIPNDLIEQLTDPFFQVESSSTRTYQGTGLGLAIAKKIIELMGGQLKITSVAGIGSEFYFTVLVKKTENQLAKKISFDHVERNDWSNMAAEFPLKILLAEDNDLNLQLMSLILEQLGYELEVARNGNEAVEKVKNQSFDLVLMDVQMPIMNGLEATQKIRKELNQPILKIIGLSANVFDEDRKKALDSGMDDYLTKPIKMDVLALKLKLFHLNLNRNPN